MAEPLAPEETGAPGPFGSGGRTLLAGWGRTSPSYATVVEPDGVDALEAALGAPTTNVIARGLGRSYGAAAQCAGGLVIETAALAGISDVEAETGLVTVGGGVSLDDLIASTLPHGWFVPVTPGTRQVSIGGALAADIHGKNHHRDSSFATHVRRFSLATPTGTVEVSPASDPELFWATAGGMGLTGVVTEATLSLLPVETSWMSVDTERFDDLDGVMAAMESGDDGYRYSVAWVDCMTRGARLGRGVLTRGEHATAKELPAAKAGSALTAPGSPRLKIPRPAPPGLLNRASIAAFNEAWFRRAPRHRMGELHPLASFFHPLDGVSDWNLLYGPRGFVQYQFAVAASESETVRRAIEALSAARVPSFLAVLKRFGPGDPGPLSFPMAGWTLALDLPVGPSALPGVLDHLDEMVAAAGGRVYLAKDARLRPELLGAMYPRLGEFEATAARVDPDGVLASDLSRRLGIGAATNHAKEHV